MENKTIFDVLKMIFIHLHTVPMADLVRNNLMLTRRLPLEGNFAEEHEETTITLTIDKDKVIGCKLLLDNGKDYALELLLHNSSLVIQQYDEIGASTPFVVYELLKQQDDGGQGPALFAEFKTRLGELLDSIAPTFDKNAALTAWFKKNLGAHFVINGGSITNFSCYEGLTTSCGSLVGKPAETKDCYRVDIQVAKGDKGVVEREFTTALMKNPAIWKVFFGESDLHLTIFSCQNDVIAKKILQPKSEIH